MIVNASHSTAPKQSRGPENLLRLLDRILALLKSSWIVWREEKSQGFRNWGRNVEKWDQQKLIFTASNKSEQSLQRELIVHAPTFPVNLPIHRVGRSCPVLNISLVSNRQEPQLSDTCLAHRHKGAGTARAQAARLGLSLCGWGNQGTWPQLPSGATEKVEASETVP